MKDKRFGKPRTLAECPPGVFLFNDCLGFKTEYGSMEVVDPTPMPGSQVRWTVGHRSDAYVLESGERFWGGAKTADEIEKLMVRPLKDYRFFV